MAIGKSKRLARKNASYHKIQHKYDKCSFISMYKAKSRSSRFSSVTGRAISAPMLTSWPLNGQHDSVTYISNIKTDISWSLSISNVRLPFRCLNVKSPRFQGLIQMVDRLNHDAEALKHFQKITDKMEESFYNPVITECVGEAAAAICMLSDTNFIGFEMIWGLHIHSGTGIDQIWRKDCGNGSYEYLIVEAKGPNASLNRNPFIPSGFNQMEFGWVMNHLYSMDNNNHASGHEIVTNLGLKFTIEHKNYMGASKSYYGLDEKSMPATSASKLYGIVVTANWESDGRLGYKKSSIERYQ